MVTCKLFNSILEIYLFYLFVWNSFLKDFSSQDEEEEDEEGDVPAKDEL